MAETASSRPRYRDTRTGRIGELDGYDGHYYVLRPLEGGPVWTCPVGSARQEQEPTGHRSTEQGRR